MRWTFVRSNNCLACCSACVSLAADVYLLSSLFPRIYIPHTPLYQLRLQPTVSITLLVSSLLVLVGASSRTPFPAF